jgi:hypothetical protein
MDSTAHFKYMQAERLNVMTLTSDTYLTPEMSGSVIITNIRGGSFSLYLPKPESGLNYRVIMKTLYNSPNTLHVNSTSNDYTVNKKINLVGGFTEKLDQVTSSLYVPTSGSTENGLSNLNVFSCNNVQRLHLGTPFEYHTTTNLKTKTWILHTNSDRNNLFNTTGDSVELICDGEDWFGIGATKNRSIYKHNGTRLIN